MKGVLSVFLACLCIVLPLGVLMEEAPALPDGTIRPLDVTLPPGQRYDVYAGPGFQYPKTGVVSTSGWVQVFGWAEGPYESGRTKWLFIQYGIEEGRMRFGYILADNLAALQKGQRPLYETLPLKEIRVLQEDAPLTDDPLGARKPLCTLRAGTQALRLAHMGEWAYVEAVFGDGLTRGFVADSALADIAWRDEREPFDLRATSWAPMVRDYAATREQYVAFQDEEGNEWERAFNTWLRLDSTENRAALERLSDFRVVSGRARCAEHPVVLWGDGYTASDGYDWVHMQFLPKAGFSRAALDVVLEAGESIENVTVACTRTRLDGTRETILLPLRGVPMDMGYPAGGAAFTLERYTPFAPADGRDAMALGRYLSLFLDQPMPDLPESVGSLPHTTGDFALYLLQGGIRKQPGPFGVYDVTFALENPPEGVYLSAYQKCGMCYEIDTFDMMSGDAFRPNGLWDGTDGFYGRFEEDLEREFAVLLLADARLWQGEALDGMVRGLRITAAFSGEKWDVHFGQHGVSSAIGPRSTERVDMGNIKRGEGTLSEVP